MKKFFEELVPDSVRFLRGIGVGCWIVAFFIAVTVLVDMLNYSLFGESLPDYNIIAKLGDASLWAYVGAVHVVLARYRQKEKIE